MMAKILSSKTNDQTLKNYIKQTALKKFNEDYNFLFSDSYGAILNPAKDASLIDSVLPTHSNCSATTRKNFTRYIHRWKRVGFSLYNAFLLAQHLMLKLVMVY